MSLGPNSTSKNLFIRQGLSKPDNIQFTITTSIEIYSIPKSI